MITKPLNQYDPPRRPLQCYDLQSSFEEGSPGHKARRVIDSRGREKLDRTVWDAGLLAYDFLKDNCEDGVSAEGYMAWVSSARAFLADDFYPDLLEMMKAGKVDLSEGSLEDFEAAWAEYDWVQRFDVFLSMLDHARAQAATEPSDLEWFKSYVACALLWRIDDAVISEFCDGRGLVENIVDIVRLCDRLSTTALKKMSIEAAIGVARKQIGKAGAAAKLAKDPKQTDKASVRECWDAWQVDPSRYKSVAAFARDMLEKFDSLESQPVIERWCREWRSSTLTQPAK